MNDPGTIVRRGLERTAPRELSLEGLYRRRDRHRRTQRITAGIVATGIALGGLAFAASVLRTTETNIPVTPTPDGAIVFLDGGRLMVTSDAGGGARPLLDPGTLRAVDGPGSCPPPRCDALPVFTWSPDGTQVLFARNDLSAPLGSEDHRWDALYEASATGTEIRFVTSCGAGSPGGMCTDVAISPDGGTIAFTTEDGILWSTSVGSQGGSNVADSVVDFAWAPNSDELTFVGSSGEVRLASVTDVSGSRSEYVASVPGQPGSLAWSPDGASLLVTSAGTSSVRSDVIIRIDRRSGKQTTIARGHRERFLSDASWSPDGTLIAWAAFPGKRFFGGPGAPFETEIWVANADGSNAHRVYATGCCVAGKTEHAFTGPAFSPDGRSLAFSVIGDREDLPNDTGIYVVNVDGSGLRQVSPTGILPAWQPLPKKG